MLYEVYHVDDEGQTKLYRSDNSNISLEGQIVTINSQGKKRDMFLLNKTVIPTKKEKLCQDISDAANAAYNHLTDTYNNTIDHLTNYSNSETLRAFNYVTSPLVDIGSYLKKEASTIYSELKPEKSKKLTTRSKRIKKMLQQWEDEQASIHRHEEAA
jgi:DNA-binding protein YbaB